MKPITCIALLCATMALSACGGGGSSSGTTTAAAAAPAVTQAQTNHAPTISGSPLATATVDVPYSFTPTASDPDGDRLTFSVQNKPSWADFDSATGRLSGLPRAGDIGSIAGVTISVSDGSASASLPSFALSVSTPVGTAVLTWGASTVNTDGTALTDLAGYRVYYGTDPADLSRRADVNDPRTLSFSLQGLAAGTWYFAMTAVNLSGAESSRTNPVTVQVE